MVQAFLPMLPEAGGRIVWVMTPATYPTPYVTSIRACDFAVNSLVRIELAPWSIRNVMIRCGGIKTPAGLRTTTDVEACLRDGPRAHVAVGVLADVGPRHGRVRQGADGPGTGRRGCPEGARLQEARRRYSVGHMARAAAFLKALPQPITDWILRARL